MNENKRIPSTPKTITAYQCPYCNFVSEKEEIVANHMQTCCKNPEYIQECMTCPYLDKDYKYAFATKKVNICPYTRHFGTGCIYKNHDASAVDKEIEKERGKYLCRKNYRKDLSPQENRKKEELYSRYIEDGMSVDEALIEVYGKDAIVTPMKKNYL